MLPDAGAFQLFRVSGSMGSLEIPMPLHGRFKGAILCALLLLELTITPLHGQARSRFASPVPRAFVPTLLCELFRILSASTERQ